MPQKKPCFIANWKMNKVAAEATTYLSDFMARASDIRPSESLIDSPEIIIAPPFTALHAVAKTLNDEKSAIGLAGQNIHFEKSGAYTGEISAEMLCEIGCGYVIIGHSERRNLFGETDEIIHQKLKAAQNSGLLPILCIGETLQDRRSGKTWERLMGQLSIALGEGRLDNHLSDGLIAYEPVWAIGTGETPKPDEVGLVHQQIQRFVRERVGKGVPRVLYGGSVSEKNIEDFMKSPHIDGVLVGGASLSAETFLKIIQLGTNAKNKG